MAIILGCLVFYGVLIGFTVVVVSERREARKHYDVGYNKGFSVVMDVVKRSHAVNIGYFTEPLHLYDARYLAILGCYFLGASEEPMVNIHS